MYQLNAWRKSFTLFNILLLIVSFTNGIVIYCISKRNAHWTHHQDLTFLITTISYYYYISMYFYFVNHHNYFILLLLLTLPKSNWRKVINIVMFLRIILYAWDNFLRLEWECQPLLRGLKEETECSWKWEVPYTNKGMWLS